VTPDHPDHTPDESTELGILPEVTRADTGILGILGTTTTATAQVSVALPTVDEDELSDDDVVGDEVSFDDGGESAPYDDGPVAPVRATDADAAADDADAVEGDGAVEGDDAVEVVEADGAVDGPEAVDVDEADEAAQADQVDEVDVVDDADVVEADDAAGGPVDANSDAGDADVVDVELDEVDVNEDDDVVDADVVDDEVDGDDDGARAARADDLDDDLDVIEVEAAEDCTAGADADEVADADADETVVDVAGADADVTEVADADVVGAAEAEREAADHADIRGDVVRTDGLGDTAAVDEAGAADAGGDAADLVDDSDDDWHAGDEPFDRAAFAALIDNTIARYAHPETVEPAPDAPAADTTDAQAPAGDVEAATGDTDDIPAEAGGADEADDARDTVAVATAAPNIGAAYPTVVDAEPVDAEPIETEPAAGALEEASVNENPAGRGHDVERVQTHRPEVSLTSKRLDQFDSGKETSDLLTADRLLERGKIAGGEPEGTWQHFVYSLSGGRINLGDGKRARERKELTTRIAAPLSGGARFVPVLSRKGGVGKTTITTLLGMALADARDDRVIAIDANPDRGTLAERIARPSGKTVRDLARMQGAVAGYNDISSIVARDQTRLDVLASDADPRVSEAFSDVDYQDVAGLAAHYYSIVLTDTGTGIVHSVMGATLNRADQLVVVSGLSIDEARLASETLTWLETNGFAGLVRSAVVVLNNSRPGTPLVREDELEAHFTTRVRTVVRMPYDPLIGTGSAITFHDLQPATRQAARRLAVAVVEGLRENATAAA
jgi:MinD-like ATPase involved in chromosome partitioning or flagellar assembly